jgi:hypothetical protein
VALLMTRAIHPNVVRFHACGRWPHPTRGFLFFVMDHVPGLPIHLWAETENPSFRRLAEVGARMAKALDALHARGVLHRDVKPEHIIIRASDGEPILVDLGAGHYEEATRLTSAALPPGTLHLRSPEALTFWLGYDEHSRKRYRPTRADDLYALGMCLYRTLTGHYPVSLKLPPDILALFLSTERPAPPASVNRRMPRALSDLLLRMLSRRAEDRYARGEEIAQALMAAVAFGNPTEWEQRLFEWEESAEAGGRAPRQRIRRPAFPARARPLTPPGSPFVLPGPPEAWPRHRGGEARPARREPAVLRPRAPSPRPRRREEGLLLALGLLLGQGETPRLVWAPAGEEAPGRSFFEVRWVSVSSPVESSSVPVTTPVMEQEEASPMKKQQQNAPSSEQARELGMGNKMLGMAVTCVGLACASVPVRPPQKDCPPEARTAMQSLGIGWVAVNNVVIDPAQGLPGWDPSEREAIVRAGPITSELIGPLGGLPDETLLDGQLFIVGQAVYGYYERARTPDGRTYPVCFRLGDKAGADVMRPGPTPDTLRVFRSQPVFAVERITYD